MPTTLDTAAKSIANIAARIKSNLAVSKLSPDTMSALDALEIPNGKGRTNDYSSTWGVNLFTK